MKLTSEDKALLRQWGYTDEDFPQIECAMQVKYTKYELGNKPISRGRAIRLLGMRKYLAGLSRSAFHWSAAQPVGDSEESGVVYFDSSRLFK